MSRLTALDPDEATGKTRELFGILQRKMGMISNMTRVLSNSSATLNAYMCFNEGMSHSTLTSTLRELIALMVANANGCDYCNAAHSFVAGEIGLDARTINDARHGVHADVKTNVALRFAREVLSKRGVVSDEVIQQVKAAGYTQGEIIDIIAQVSLSIFTNYINMAALTDIDFPKLAPIINNNSLNTR